MKKILVTGATGLVGCKLVNRLTDLGYYVITTSRNPERINKTKIRANEYIKWDIDDASSMESAIKQVYGIVNLAGTSIASGRWSKSLKSEILKSRVDSTQLIVEIINKLDSKPSVLVNASAIGYYGDCGNLVLNENSELGHGFLSDVCNIWENTAKKANTRVVMARIGIVLSKTGGALEKLIPPFMMMVGGPLGSGNQYWSWIHIDDLVNMIIFSIENENISGPINCVSPNPLKMKEFGKVLGHILNKPSIFPTPSFILKLLLGESASMVLNSQIVIPEIAIRNNFHFEFEDLNSALFNLLKK